MNKQTVLPSGRLSGPFYPILDRWEYRQRPGLVSLRTTPLLVDDRGL